MTSKDHSLEAMIDEVRDFHPFLALLLPKLPDVQHVDYTHGPNEMGADFVIQKLDGTTGETRYVGVIAKLGKIGQKDADEVEKQLRESKVPRKICGGTQTIRLNEVWVVCTGTISSGAQNRIHNESAFLSVTFIPSSRLITLVDKHAPQLWDEAPGALGVYLSKLSEKLNILDGGSNILGISTPAKPLELEIVALDPTAVRKSRKPETTTLSQEIELRRFLLLEGQPGSGKSFLIRSEARRLADNAKRAPDSSPIPLYVTHRELATKYERSMERCVRGELEDAADPNNTSQRFVIFVDGLDEYTSDMTYNEALAGMASRYKPMPD
jgi:hypothetical protein